MEKVTAVILNYNSFDDTKKCLSLLVQQNYSNFSIAVVDNASPRKGEVEKLRNLKREYKFYLLISEYNHGFSAGNNLGIRYALKNESDWILILNPDVEIRDFNFIEKVLTIKKDWQSVGLIGTRSILPDGFNQNPLRELTPYEEINYISTYLKEKRQGRNYYKMPESTGYCEKLVGCCFFLSGDFIKNNNMLDENVFMYSEEPIIAKSAQRLGYKLLYIDELEVYHQHHDKAKSGSAPERMIMSLNSRKYYIKKYSGYSHLEKILALLVKEVQIFLWRVKEWLLKK